MTFAHCTSHSSIRVTPGVECVQGPSLPSSFPTIPPKTRPFYSAPTNFHPYPFSSSGDQGISNPADGRLPVSICTRFYFKMTKRP